MRGDVTDAGQTTNEEEDLVFGCAQEGPPGFQGKGPPMMSLTLTSGESGDPDQSGESGKSGDSVDSGESGEAGDSGESGDLVNPAILVNLG